MKNVEKLLNLWYHVWNNAYLSMAAEYQKWHKQVKNMQLNDIVLFMIKDLVFASVWKIGKVDSIDMGRENLVRGVSISYKVDKEEARHMLVQRPAKHIVKLFHISDIIIFSVNFLTLVMSEI